MRLREKFKIILYGLSLLVLPTAMVACASAASPNSYESADFAQRARFKRVSLPLRPVTHFTISSGAFGCCTHNIPGYEYAWDFDVPYGSPVLAVEDGTVIQVWEPDNKEGGCDKKFMESAHNIKVLAQDGTVSQYVHIQSRVRKGASVKKGMMIALTANNGFHCAPQLHFNIFKDENHLPEKSKALTIPVMFDGLPNGGLAEEGYRGVVKP